MTSGFTPQVTTMNSYSKIEGEVYEDFLRIGCSGPTAQVAAHSFTQYVLGYIDDAKVIRNLVETGVTDDFAASVLESFRKATRAARPAYVQRPEKRSDLRETVHG